MSRPVTSHGWLILTKRYGADVRAPTAVELAEAVREVFDPTIDDEEHGAAFLRYGHDDGPMYVVELTCGRIARYVEWADQDDVEPLAPAREAEDVGDAEALQLWTLLSRGDVAALRGWRWRPADAT